jgi:hypothetical protein
MSAVDRRIRHELRRVSPACRVYALNSRYEGRHRESRNDAKADDDNRNT